MYQQYLPVAKMVAGVVSGLGVSKIVNDIVRNNVVIATPLQGITVKVGGFVLGSMLWEQSTKHIDRATDDTVAMIEKLKKSKDTSSE